MSPRRLIKGYTINLLVLCFNHSAITKWVHWLPMLLPMMLPGYQHWWYKLPNFGWHYHSWKRSEPTGHIAISNNGISVEILYISSKTIQRVDGSETFFIRCGLAIQVALWLQVYIPTECQSSISSTKNIPYDQWHTIWLHDITSILTSATEIFISLWWTGVSTLLYFRHNFQSKFIVYSFLF